MSNERMDASVFIAKWKDVRASELSTSQSFLIDLCALLGVETPHPTPAMDYMFERPVTFMHGDGSTSAGRIDLYRRGHFVLESKKIKAGSHTKGFDEAMLRARSQAEAYARAIPGDEGRPPFLLVVDVGQRIELYAEFSRSGGTYTPYPDPRAHRIALEDLARQDIRERLKRIWTDPMSLDPARMSAKVTREIAAKLAELAKSLEGAGHPADAVAQFLMRCLFTMFAEDVRLLPEESFRKLLVRHAAEPEVAMQMLAQLWRDMDQGGFSAVLAGRVLRFNGKLFKQPETLPLNAEQVALLIEAARADWRHVEPAIFGTLLERALNPTERHKLGAHYTPRSYVERLVIPTVIEPLREEWTDAQAAALTLAAEGDVQSAVDEILKFHHRLCTVRVLDPACGSANFLYVTLEHLKRLEGEVLNALDELGHRQTDLALGSERADAAAGETVDPHNLLGIEINPRAAAIAEVVLWIGYLQWHFRTRGDVSPPIPVIRDFRNIECRDALLDYERLQSVTDEGGVPLTRWDGKTMKRSPVTGEDIPDDSARVPVVRYMEPRKAEWPSAEFIVGNPPFIGNKRMRSVLDDGYVDALRAVWSDVPESADFVMYWWHRAASLVRDGEVRRFGFITTNSIRQTFNRRVLEGHLFDKTQPLSLVFAIPDHPWVDTAEGAAVRIAMTAGESGGRDGLLRHVTSEEGSQDGEIVVDLADRRAVINSDLTSGANVAGAIRLKANASICGQGVKVVGDGFYVDSNSEPMGQGISRIINARDVLDGSLSGRPIIDFFELTEEQARSRNPAAYQQVLTRVKPLRDQNKRKSIRELWWRFAWERPVIRKAVRGLNRYFVTLSTAKHGLFVAVEGHLVWDGALFAIATDDWRVLGVLSSTIHRIWALAAGGTLEDRPTWTNSTCFEPFPFPDWVTADKFGSDIVSKGAEYPSEAVSRLAQSLDLHRKRQQAAHPGLTLTGIYNVLEKLRSGDVLSAKERSIHDQGLVSVLRQIHDELDEAVMHAYGWGDLVPLLRVVNGTDAPAEGQTKGDARHHIESYVLERLVALNAERAAREARGDVLWLRPEYQNPSADSRPEQTEIDATNGGHDSESEDEGGFSVKVVKPMAWPKEPVAQVRAVAEVLADSRTPMTLDDIAARFTARGPWKKRLPQLLAMVSALGRVEATDDGRWRSKT
ncbi:hypothetical protein GCM10028794_28340 [Silanimonas algicola]